MAERIEELPISVTTTGTAGSASGTGVSPKFANGAEVLRTRWDYHASAPNTTDVTLYETSLGATDGKIDSKSNSATDAIRYPRIASLQDNAGADLAANEQTEPYCVSAGGTLTVSVAQCDALTAAAVCYVQVRRF